MKELILVALFIVTSIVGYKIIEQVPSLLHTPLMSGMNALSGVPILGAMITVSAAVVWGNKILGLIAIILASINLVGGFAVTHKMLKMFKKEGDS